MSHLRHHVFAGRSTFGGNRIERDPKRCSGYGARTDAWRGRPQCRRPIKVWVKDVAGRATYATAKNPESAVGVYGFCGVCDPVRKDKAEEKRHTKRLAELQKERDADDRKMAIREATDDVIHVAKMWRRARLGLLAGVPECLADVTEDLHKAVGVLLVAEDPRNPVVRRKR